jgi:hypothetical protein
MAKTSGQKQKLMCEPRLTVTKQHRTHSTIFALLIGCSSLLGATTAYAEDYNGLSYTLNSPTPGQARLDGLSDNGTPLTVIDIPATLRTPDQNYSVVSIAYRAFFKKQITAVTIPEGIINIGGSAFSDNKIASLIIPESATNIESYAFASNVLTSVILPNNATHIVEGIFLSNKTLLSITIPESVITIEKNAFSESGLTSLIIPNSVTSIGEYAFFKNSIASLTLGSSVKTIGLKAFFSNELASLVVPDSVTSIEESAFAVSKLTSVTLGEGLLTIGKYAFRDNDDLSKVTFLGNYPTSGNGFDNSAFQYTNLSVIEACNDSTGWAGVSFQNVAVTLVSCEISFGGLAYELTDKVESAFEYYQSNVASSIKTSCSGCHSDSKGNFGSLSSDNLANYNVLAKYISDGFGDTLLDKVSGEISHAGGGPFPVDSTEYDALSGFLKLENDQSTSAPSPAAATVLGRAIGFDETDIVIPDTITWNSKTYPVTSIAPDAFREIPITSVTIGDNVLNIGDSAFMSTLLTSVTFGNSVTTIAGGAFYQYMSGGGLTSVNLPDSLISIGNSAFCVQKLTSVTLPASMTTIGASAFCDITSVSFLGDYSTAFDDSAFDGNPELSVEACFDSESWKDVSFLTTQTNSSQINVKVTYCSSVYVSRIAKAADTSNGTNLAFSDLTRAGLEGLIEDNFAAYLAAIVAADSGTLNTFTEMQTLINTINASEETDSGNNSFSIDGLSYELKKSTSNNVLDFYIQNVASTIETCLSCHTATIGSLGAFVSNANQANYDVLAKFIADGNGELLLSNVRGENHGGGERFNVNTSEYIALSNFLNFEKDKNAFTATVKGRSIDSTENDVVIPSSVLFNDITYAVTSIGNEAFKSNQLTSVIIPDSVTSIKKDAFNDNSLTSLSIPDSVTSIGAYAFSFNINLTSVTFLGDYDSDFSSIAFAVFNEGNNLNVIMACEGNGWSGISFVLEEDIGGQLPNLSVTSDCDLSARHDVNGDGKGDILWRNHADGRNALWTMDGMSIADTSLIDKVDDQNWKIVGRGDFNGDKKSDILWRNAITGGNRIWHMDGTSRTSNDEINVVPGSDWTIKAVNDFDGDAKDDILWRNLATGQVYMYLMSGEKIRARSSLRTVADLNWQIAVTADVDGDNKDDLIWRHKITGKNYIWIMDGLTETSGYMLNNVNTSWKIVGAGDLNGDNTDDIIWRNQVDGRNYGHIMKDGKVQTSQLINIVGEQDWQITDVLDLDGDGKDDLFWRNISSGLPYIYLMDGIAIKERGRTRTVDTNWQNID